MPYQSESYRNARLNEIRDLKPEIFKFYLEDIDEETIRTYEHAKTQIGYSSREDRISRYNKVGGTLSVNLRNADTFTLKLMELAILFPSDAQWERFAVGDPSRGEGPLSDQKIADVFNTTVNNVVMKKMLDEAISKFRTAQREESEASEKGRQYCKNMD